MVSHYSIAAVVDVLADFLQGQIQLQPPIPDEVLFLKAIYLVLGFDKLPVLFFIFHWHFPILVFLGTKVYLRLDFRHFIYLK